MIGFNKNEKEFAAIDCISGKAVKYRIGPGGVAYAGPAEGETENLPFAGPGLVDLQINGVNGIDFNDASLSEDGLLSAARYLSGRGVTTFFPAVITNSEENTGRILSVIDRACRAMPEVAGCIGGIHLEGPFISESDGYRGAHYRKYVRAPDWDFFCSLQRASGNRIKIITMSPEWKDSAGFIRKCRKNGVIVGIAHSSAGTSRIAEAVEAGARLSTHLGNSVPLMLPRHPNIIWDQLAEDRLFASIVADGYHLPDSFIRVVLKVKKSRTLLISDATCFSGLAPGVYKTHIGGEVVLEEGGRLSMKGEEGLLAGAARLLPENIEYLIGKDIAKLSRAWHMASCGPAEFAGLRKSRKRPGDYPDMVVFGLDDGKINVSRAIREGEIIYGYGDK